MPSFVTCDICPAPVSITYQPTLNNYTCNDCGTLYYPEEVTHA